MEDLDNRLMNASKSFANEARLARLSAIEVESSMNDPLIRVDQNYLRLLREKAGEYRRLASVWEARVRLAVAGFLRFGEDEYSPSDQYFQRTYGDLVRLGREQNRLVYEKALDQALDAAAPGK